MTRPMAATKRMREGDETGGDDDGGGTESDDENTKPGIAKKPKLFSKFAFTGKVHKLVEELKRALDEDCICKFGPLCVYELRYATRQLVEISE